MSSLRRKSNQPASSYFFLYKIEFLRRKLVSVIKMKIFEHLKCFFSFWKPSLARRITFYFLVFGLIIFLVTSMLYMFAGKKHFVRSTGKLIHDQFSQLENSNAPDFIWRGVGHRRPELHRLLELLANLSSSFYSVSDISIYSRSADRSSWHRLYFSDSPILHVEPIEDPYIDKLDSWLHRRFRRSEASIFSANGSLSLFVFLSTFDSCR